MWKQIESTPAHLTYLIVSGFLILYALFSLFIRNRLHLSEPPLALLTGILFGPKGLNALNPIEWGLEDDITQEFTRIIVSLQVFAVGLELPKHYAARHWRSVAWLLGPVMAFGWLVCAIFIKLIFNTNVSTALTIAACLTPTDPVLAASVLSSSQFSNRVPKRIKNLLSTESGCNDGVSFPFLYAGLAILTKANKLDMLKEWGLVTVLYQCVLGTIIGIVLGLVANRALRFADTFKLIGSHSFVVFYLLLAILSTGIGSTLGLDDFLVAFSAGATFANDGWFEERTKESQLNDVLDLLLNSTFFVYLGTVIPWSNFRPLEATPDVTPARLMGLLVLILLFRRIPIVLALKRYIPDITTWAEAWFCGHFGPMGVGAIFLAIEARAQMETDTSSPLGRPDPTSKYIKSIELVWTIVSFVVLGSTLVHGLSVGAISVWVHFTRHKADRADTIGGETEPLTGMHHDSSEEESAAEEEAEEGTGRRECEGQIQLPK